MSLSSSSSSGLGGEAAARYKAAARSRRSEAGGTSPGHGRTEATSSRRDWERAVEEEGREGEGWGPRNDVHGSTPPPARLTTTCMTCPFKGVKNYLFVFLFGLNTSVSKCTF